MKLLPAFAIFFCYLSCINAEKPSAAVIDKNKTDTISISDDDAISLVAVGDIMFGTNFPDESTLPPDDGKNLMQYFSRQLQDADITFGNAEGVFLNTGGTPKGIGPNVFCFRQPTRYAQYFADNGFDLISVANNHVADFGEEGISSTVTALKNLSLHFAGLPDHPTTIITVKGIKIGMAAFAPHKGCVQMNNHAAAAAIVKKLKKECDIVLVSFHGGAEGAKATHVPKKTEMFFSQNRGNVYAFAHDMIDAGADVILGHGPHVARAMEVYKNKFIAYSLGNFCTYGMFNLEGVSGIAPLLKIYIDKKGNFINGTITSIKQEKNGGPLPDENYEAYKLIKSLTATDIPDSHLQFTDSVAIKKD